MKNLLDSEAANPFMEETGDEFNRCSAIPPRPSVTKNTNDPNTNSKNVRPMESICIIFALHLPIFHS
jgi:hypothetical protein